MDRGVEGVEREASAVDPSTMADLGETTFLRTLVESTSEGIITIDESSRIVFANRMAGEIFGYEPDDLVDQSLLELVPDRLAERHVEAMEHYLRTGERSLDWDAIELPGVHRDGHEVSLSISFRETTADGRRFFTGIVRDAADRKRRERDLSRYATIVDTVGDAIYELDASGRIVAVNDVVCEVTGYDREELVGEPVSKLLDDDALARGASAIQTLMTDEETAVVSVELEIVTADGETIPCEDRISLLRSEGEFVGSVGVVRDISERKGRERELERQRDELERLDRINSIIREIDQVLVGSSSRAEIERTVCDRFAASDLYRFAWIGDRSTAGQSVTSRTRANVDDDFLRFVAEADATEGEGVPAGQALRSERSCVVNDISGDDRFSPAWRAAALEQRFESIGAFPLKHGETTYGVLVLYSVRPDAFEERERTVFEELGGTIAYAINAVESKKLLYADTVVETEFRTANDNSVFNAVSRQEGCRFSLEGTVPATGDGMIYYVICEGAPTDRVIEAMTRSGNVIAADSIAEYDDRSLVRFTIAGSSVVRALLNAGTRVTSAVADEGESRLVAEVAPDADVRTVYETLRKEFPDVELVAQRERERPPQDPAEFQAEVVDRLTGRQRAVLQSAHLAGYFARPRTTSGTDLASSLGVTPSTFHQHLQAGLRKVVAAVFE